MESTPQKLGLILKYFSEFTDEQVAQLTALQFLYEDWNSKINVISRKDIDELYTRHVLHSLGIAKIMEFKAGSTIMDVGTGGGFPGIPLAILFPDSTFYLIDVIAKKIKVVNEVASALGLNNVKAEQMRAEHVKSNFDFAVSRAVAPLKDLVDLGCPLIRKGTNNGIAQGLICLKGGDLNQEISESGLRPKMMPIFKIFPEEYFQEKYIIHAARN